MLQRFNIWTATFVLSVVKQIFWWIVEANPFVGGRLPLQDIFRGFTDKSEDVASEIELCIFVLEEKSMLKIYYSHFSTMMIPKQI